MELAVAENSPIIIEDANNVFGWIALNPFGRDLAWNWIRDNLEPMFRRFSGVVASIVEEVTDTFTSRSLLSDFETLAEQNKGFFSFFQPTVDKIQMNIGFNIKWQALNEETVKKWLKEQNQPS